MFTCSYLGSTKRFTICFSLKHTQTAVSLYDTFALMQSFLRAMWAWSILLRTLQDLERMTVKPAIMIEIKPRVPQSPVLLSIQFNSIYSLICHFTLLWRDFTLVLLNLCSPFHLSADMVYEFEKTRTCFLILIQYVARLLVWHWIIWMTSSSAFKKVCSDSFRLHI